MVGPLRVYTKGRLSLTIQDIASSAVAYLKRGWKVIPLHSVAGGTCSCGSSDPKHDWSQGGKHPVFGNWQNGGLSDPATVREAWARRPGANIGIVTGRASGLWVLDVDPDNDGDKRLAALVAAWGPLPETYTVRTGSDGAHYYWRMPYFDFTTSRGRLPAGLDVRGNNGQVVAPPSVSLKGAYYVALDAPVVDAPGWLLGLIKPPERLDVADTPREDWAPSTPPTATSERGSAYAVAAVRAILGELAAAHPGTRNETAFRCACRLAEMVNATWAGLDPDHVWAGYMAATQACDVDGGFPQSEAYDVLRKAVIHVGDRDAILPAAAHLGTAMPWTDTSDFGRAGQDPAAAAPPEGGGVEALFEDQVRQEVGRLMVRAEAARRVAQMGRRVTDFSQELMTGSGLDDLPVAVALVDRYLNMDTLARVNGPSGHGKSFVTLDFACCVATGRPWHGHAVTQAEAWYVIGEGAYGMRLRELAWCERIDASMRESGVRFLARALQVDGPEWETFVAHARRARPGLIVFDTQARMTVGVKENDATEMGVVVEALDALRQASGACVLLVHHRGLSGEHGRGSSAIKGALDTELDVTRTGATVTVRVTKQKDQMEAPPLLLTMNPLGESLVLVADGDATATTPGAVFTSPSVQLSNQERAAMAIAYALIAASGSGLTRGEACAHARVAMELPSTDSTRRMIRRAWSDLVGLGRIAKAQGREAHFWIDLPGVAILAANPGKSVQGSPELYIPDA